ncbi:MAG: acyl carrier protein [Bryobacteraceae bacterium]|nr:acyl carrier protein [Bryobacteraceae bacterium]
MTIEVTDQVNATLFSKVQDLVAQVFGIPVEKVLPESTPETIDTWDSLQHLNLVLAIEQEFHVQFTPEEIEQLQSVELISMLVEEKVSACEVADGR